MSPFMDTICDIYISKEFKPNVMLDEKFKKCQKCVHYGSKSVVDVGNEVHIPFHWGSLKEYKPEQSHK
jgi:hypothetical protein